MFPNNILRTNHSHGEMRYIKIIKYPVRSILSRLGWTIEKPAFDVPDPFSELLWEHNSSQRYQSPMRRDGEIKAPAYTFDYSHDPPFPVEEFSEPHQNTYIDEPHEVGPYLEAVFKNFALWAT